MNSKAGNFTWSVDHSIRSGLWKPVILSGLVSLSLIFIGVHLLQKGGVVYLPVLLAGLATIPLFSGVLLSSFESGYHGRKSPLTTDVYKRGLKLLGVVLLPQIPLVFLSSAIVGIYFCSIHIHRLPALLLILSWSIASALSLASTFVVPIALGRLSLIGDSEATFGRLRKSWTLYRETTEESHSLWMSNLGGYVLIAGGIGFCLKAYPNSSLLALSLFSLWWCLVISLRYGHFLRGRFADAPAPLCGVSGLDSKDQQASTNPPSQILRDSSAVFLERRVTLQALGWGTALYLSGYGIAALGPPELIKTAQYVWKPLLMVPWLGYLVEATRNVRTHGFLPNFRLSRRMLFDGLLSALLLIYYFLPFLALKLMRPLAELNVLPPEVVLLLAFLTLIVVLYGAVLAPLAVEKFVFTDLIRPAFRVDEIWKEYKKDPQIPQAILMICLIGSAIAFPIVMLLLSVPGPGLAMVYVFLSLWISAVELFAAIYLAKSRMP